MRRAESDVVSGGVGGLGSGSDVEAVATIDGEVESYIASGADINTAAGTTTILADSMSETDAFAHGGNGSVGISVSLFAGTARVGNANNGSTKAWIEDDASVISNDLSVSALADNNAKTDLLAVSVGLAGGGGNASSVATTNADTEAFIEGADIDVMGTIDIQTESSGESKADIRSGAGGIGRRCHGLHRDSPTVLVKLGHISGVVQRLMKPVRSILPRTFVGATADSDVVVGSGAAVSIGLSKAVANQSA